MSMIKAKVLRSKTLEYVERMRIAKTSFEYRYGASSEKPVLYASCYAAMTKDIYNDLSDSAKQEWASFLQSFQNNDGLFKDPVVSDSEFVDYDWWGWRHLTCHAIIALACLNAVAKKEFVCLKPFYNPDFVIRWLENRDWATARSSNNAGNEILNYGHLLQYARDFQNIEKAKKPVEIILEWLSEKMNPQYGAWGPAIVTDDRISLAQVIMGGYHEYLLFFYDKRKLKYAELIIDRILSLQNEEGGFTGPHHPASSACQDIDCMDPLVRLTRETDYKKEAVRESLKKAIVNVVNHQNEDGGFVFFRNNPFTYGHKEMASAADESSMFATWFRTLSLAIASTVLPDTDMGRYDWRFQNCPGYQFK